MQQTRPPTAPLYSQALAHAGAPPRSGGPSGGPSGVITVAAGATCAYLSDERGLREYLVADETARHLRRAGHVVLSLLFDDSMDPLTPRQLRVAVNKNDTLIERYAPWCGKPIACLPDPWGCHSSWAEHFEEALLDRLGELGCRPTLIGTAGLYAPCRGLYAPHVAQILARHDEIVAYLAQRFPEYHPDALFRPLCPRCEYLDETRITRIDGGCLFAQCARCDQDFAADLFEARGKLNWKLDCALRWALFGVDAEPFSKAYLEPRAGSFVVAQALSRRFFGGHGNVLPLLHGLVKLDRSLADGALGEALPPAALRSLLVEHPSADLHLTPAFVTTTASRFETAPGMSYLDFVKQVLPLWLLDPLALSASQRDLVARGLAFTRHVEGREGEAGVAPPPLPTRAVFAGEEPVVLRALSDLVGQAICLREAAGVGESGYEAFHAPMKRVVNGLDCFLRRAVLRRLRRVSGQEQGLPATRLLFLLPLPYLRLVVDLLELLEATTTAMPRRDDLRAA